MTFKCPHCGHDIVPRTGFQEKLIKLADGTRTRTEIAEILNKKRENVIVSLWNLKRKGLNVEWVDEFVTKKLSDKDLDDMLELRRQRASYKAIAKQFHISAAHASRMIHRQRRRRSIPREEFYYKEDKWGSKAFEY